MPTICSLLLLLPPLLRLVAAVPITVEPDEQTYEIWVTKFNTLNATTWGVPDANSSVIRLAFNQTEHANLTKSLSERSLNTRLESSRMSNIIERSMASKVMCESTDGSSDNDLETIKEDGAGPCIGEITKGPKRIVRGDSWNETHLVDRTIESRDGGYLVLELVNRLPSYNVRAYVTGLDPNGALIMLGQDGTFKYPMTTSGVPVPIKPDVTIPLAGPNTTLPIVIPGFITSGRIWIADGELQFYVVATAAGPGLVEPAVANPKDPNAAVNYAFAELTWGDNIGIYADISAVDFVGLPLGIELLDWDNNLASILGTPSNAAPWLCDQLTAQSKIDHVHWDDLCSRDETGDLIRVLSPNNYLSSNPTAFGSYYGLYVGDVWNYYTNNDLIIDTQTGAGNVTCRVVNDELTCAGDNRGYARPTYYDIFGCNTGPFAIQGADNAIHYAVVPRLCAAFNRATLLLPGGNVTPSLPPSSYYNPYNRPVWTRPFNHYSALVHQMEAGGRGYAFSYDDVAPSPEEDQSGLVTSPNPRLLRIIAGGT